MWCVFVHHQHTHQIIEISLVVKFMRGGGVMTKSKRFYFVSFALVSFPPFTSYTQSKSKSPRHYPEKIWTASLPLDVQPIVYKHTVQNKKQNKNSKQPATNVKNYGAHTTSGNKQLQSNTNQRLSILPHTPKIPTPTHSHGWG